MPRDRAPAKSNVFHRPMTPDCLSELRGASLFPLKTGDEVARLGFEFAAASLPDGLDVLGAAEQAIDEQAEHGAEGMAAGFRAAGVGQPGEGLAQGAQFGAFEGAARARGVAVGDGGLVGGRQDSGAGKQGEGVFFQRPNPEVLGFAGVLIEVAAVPFVAFGEAEWLPVGGLVEGAGVFFWSQSTCPAGRPAFR